MMDCSPITHQIHEEEKRLAVFDGALPGWIRWELEGNRLTIEQTVMRSPSWVPIKVSLLSSKSYLFGLQDPLSGDLLTGAMSTVAFSTFARAR